MENNKSWLQRNIIGFSLTSFFNDFSHELATAILPTFVRNLVGLSYAPFALGIISGFSDAAATVVKLWSGLLADKIKRYKPLLAVGYTLTPLFVGLIGTAHHVWQVFVYKIVAWIGKGLREPMRDTWITQLVTRDYYGRAFGVVRAADTLGAIAGPLVAYFALWYFTLPTIFYFSFIPGALSVFCFIAITKERDVQPLTPQTIYWREQIYKLPSSFLFFLGVMLLFGISNFSKILLIYRAQEVFTDHQNPLVATSSAILLYIFFNCIRAVSEFGFGLLSDYFNRKILLAVFGLGFFSLSCVLLTLSEPTVWIWIFTFLTAAVSAGTVTTLHRVYAADLLPTDVRGTGFGILQAINGIGNLISSAIVGILWSTVSPEFSFMYAAVVSFVATILLLIK